MSILDKLLLKRGIKNTDELQPEEKAQFEVWKRTLNKEQLTVDDFKLFCQIQIDIIEGKWRDLNLDHSKKSELIPYHTVYKAMLLVIDSPKTAREALEIQLTQMVNS